MAEIAIVGATAVLRHAVLVLGNLVVKESSRLLRLTEDLEWVENEMGYIQAYLADIEDKQEGSKGLTKLVRNIWDIAYDVEDIVNAYFPKLASSGRKGRKGRLGWVKSTKFILNNYKTARDFAVEIEGIKRRIDDIDRVRRVYDIKERSPRDEENAWDPRQSFPHDDERSVVGLDENIKELVARVDDKDSQHRVVSITGMPGLGKTTLARKVYNSVRGKFDCSAWICVSQQPNVAELLRDVARQVGLEKDKWEQNLVGNLFAFLSGKRYVIVIDDLWQIEPWDDGLKKGIPNNSENGSRIILTSRNRDVGVHVGGPNSVHELLPLDEARSRDLFLKKVGGAQTSDSKQLEQIRKDILKKCGGVPLAIVLTSGMLVLRERTESAWRRVLESIGQEEDSCSKIFALSYKDLPTKLKPCFLCFGRFPEDYEICAFHIINLWAAEGLVRRGNGVRDVEAVGEEYLNQLIARSLIQVAKRSFDGRIKSYRIHDILHGLCVRVAKEINFFNTHTDLVTGNSAMRLRRLSTNFSSLLEYISYDYRAPRLRAILCFDREEQSELKRKHVKDFLGDSRFLQVLWLEFQSVRISLPREIRNLSHLTYLQLKSLGYGSRIKIPSIISNLGSLQTLDARDCRGWLTIPDCIFKMKQLIHILLPDVYDVKHNNRVGQMLNMGKFLHPETCPNLQTLFHLKLTYWARKYRFPKYTNLRKLGFYFWHDEISDVKTFLEKSIVSHKLEILRLYGHRGTASYKIQDLNLYRYENLCRLDLRGAPLMELPKRDELPPNLTHLTLKHTEMEEDPMESLKKLPKLKFLKLGVLSYARVKLMVCSDGPDTDNFPQLQVLKIVRLDFLEELTVEEGVMPRLNKLIIRDCRRLTVTTASIPKRIRDIMEITQ